MVTSLKKILGTFCSSQWTHPVPALHRTSPQLGLYRSIWFKPAWKELALEQVEEQEADRQIQDIVEIQTRAHSCIHSFRDSSLVEAVPGLSKTQTGGGRGKTFQTGAHGRVSGPWKRWMCLWIQTPWCYWVVQGDESKKQWEWLGGLNRWCMWRFSIYMWIPIMTD